MLGGKSIYACLFKKLYKVYEETYIVMVIQWQDPVLLQGLIPLALR